MKSFMPLVVAMLIISASYDVGDAAGERWQEDTFPPPNGGRLVFAITNEGNPACASYDGRNCLWGKSVRDIDFARVKPLVCGAAHRQLYGVTGFEDPNHWCNLLYVTAQRRPLRQRPRPLR
jgi:hypothetical protein